MRAHLARRGKTKQASKYASAQDVGVNLESVSKCVSALDKKGENKTSEQVCERSRCRGKLGECEQVCERT